MGRLVLKDGKLTTETTQQPHQEVPKVPLPPIDIEYTRPQQEGIVEEYAEPPMFTGRPQQREVVREMPVEPPIFRGRPAQQYQQPVQEVTVDIIIVEGQTVQVKVPVNAAQGLLDAISASIETGSMLVVGNKAINPRHIVMYQYV